MPVNTGPLIPEFPIDFLPIASFFVDMFRNPESIVDLLFSNGVILFLFLFSAILLAFVTYLVINIMRAGEQYRASFRFEPVESEQKTPDRWTNVLNHLESENSSDWRMAILEADSILEEMVQRMGYGGSTLGDRLKNIEPSDFTTLNDAWEAHKVRNAIAHEGSERQLTKREAKRVVGLYEAVFKEFHYL